MTLPTPVLVHLCGVLQWSRARRDGAIRPPSADPAFIHLSTPEQVHLPANRLYRGRKDLVLLHVDPAALTAEVRWEPGVPTDPEAMLFPHLFGELPVRAVTGITAYLPDVEGFFAALPSAG